MSRSNGEEAFSVSSSGEEGVPESSSSIGCGNGEEELLLSRFGEEAITAVLRTIRLSERRGSRREAVVGEKRSSEKRSSEKRSLVSDGEEEAGHTAINSTIKERLNNKKV